MKLPLSLSIAGLFSASLVSAQAGLVNFETDTAGNPIVAPNLFSGTTPLTELYAPFGIHFSGPIAGQGGAILNQLASFGVSARSGSNFLAFNSATYGAQPETIAFDLAMSSISLFVAGGSNSGTFVLTAYDASNVIVDSDTVTTQAYSELSVSSGAGIRRLVLTTADSAFVVDDLTFTPAAVPEPATGLFGAALSGVVGLSRRRSSASAK
jgi:hypothetical protein